MNNLFLQIWYKQAFFQYTAVYIVLILCVLASFWLIKSILSFKNNYKNWGLFSKIKQILIFLIATFFIGLYLFHMTLAIMVKSYLSSSSIYILCELIPVTLISYFVAKKVYQLCENKVNQYVSLIISSIVFIIFEIGLGLMLILFTDIPFIRS